MVSQRCPTVQAVLRTNLTSPRGNMGSVKSDTARGVLAANLRRLIERDTPRGERVSVRAWATGKGLDVRMIDRLTKGQHAVTLDKLQEIAEACGLQAWQLLVDDFDPASPPDSPISDEDRALLRRLRRMLESG